MKKESISYIAFVKSRWWMPAMKVDFMFKENAVDYCRKAIREGKWGKVKIKVRKCR